MVILSWMAKNLKSCYLIEEETTSQCCYHKLPSSQRPQLRWEKESMRLMEPPMKVNLMSGPKLGN